MVKKAIFDADVTGGVPPRWEASGGEQRLFFEKLRVARAPVLICDYDGTLAPFRIDKMQAAPFPGVAERLHGIAAGRTRLAFVSGRPAAEVIQLLPLAAEAEIWGMHGREHRTADGQTRLIEPTEAQRAALDQAEDRLAQLGAEALLERKIGSLALHWRALEEGGAERKRVEALALEVLAPHAGDHALALLPFDGGLELRAMDQTKGDAINALLAGVTDPVAAFLGDDLTDEDAFLAMRAKGGLPLLVREPPRPSHALFSLRPPEELLAFFDRWLDALAGTGSGPA